MKSYWRDGIFGVVVGDALGCPVQFKDRTIVEKDPVTDMRGYGTFNLPAGTWTDDSSLTLALLDSICKTDKLDLHHIMGNFVSWLDEGNFTPFGTAFDIGMGTRRAISAYKHRKNPRQCGSYDERNNGNGSLMRILPACLYCYEQGLEDKEAIKQIHLVGSLTHAHICSNIACGLYYFMVKAILAGDGYTFTDQLQEGLDHGFAYYEKSLTDHEYLENYDRLRDLYQFAETPSEKIKSSGYVVCTLEAAIWSLINTDSFESALLKAVNLGNDSDTVGAVTGGLAALKYGCGGTSGIPQKWTDTIQRKEWIAELCETAENRFDKRGKDRLSFCHGFYMEDPAEAYEHIDRESEFVKDYGEICGTNKLHTGDGGHRELLRCRRCGGYILAQFSELHNPEGDSCYMDYFPVAGPILAGMTNKLFDGEKIEKELHGRWLSVDDHPHWRGDENVFEEKKETRSDVFYLDDEHNIVDYDKATSFVIHEYDENGVMIKEIWGFVNH